MSDQRRPFLLHPPSRKCPLRRFRQCIVGECAFWVTIAVPEQPAGACSVAVLGLGLVTAGNNGLKLLENYVPGDVTRGEVTSDGD